MLFWTILKTALKALLAHKLRSALAMLGIIIGVGAFIVMLAMGAGARQSILARVTAMGTDLLIVRPGQSAFGGAMTGTQINLTLDDARALLAVEGVRLVAPVARGRAQLKYYNKNTSSTVYGTSTTYFPMRGYEIQRGRTFTETEVERQARVAILGPDTVLALFGDADPLGETVKIKGINFRVIGVTKAKGDQGFFNPDDQATIPYTTAMKQLLGRTRSNLDEVDMQAEEGYDVNRVIEDATALLRRRHRIPAGMPEDFNIRSQAEMIESFVAISRTLTLLLGGIAFVSLIVGGIGIMNIMLVSVSERTREIGIRKAIGARDRDVLKQFLIEAIAMSGVGGLLGAALGIGFAKFMGAFTDFNTIIETFSVVLALSFAGAVGIFFGFYPAWRASRLNPIEALRYE
ncbi:MAG: FtsX-like permease family protein [Planctomycetes bacterium]|nr:FtsX-like permease family protein [Planctomycetota bacterium]